MKGCMNYRGSGSQDDSRVSHLRSWVNDGTINLTEKYRHFVFHFEG